MFRPSAQQAASPGQSQLVQRWWIFCWWVVVAGVDLVEGMPLHQPEVVVAGVLVVANAISGLVLISLVLLKPSLWVVVVLGVRLSPLIAHLAMVGQLAQPLALPISVRTGVILVVVEAQSMDQVVALAHPSCFSIQVLPATVEQAGQHLQGKLAQLLTAILSLAQVVGVGVVRWQTS
jgi:hypothetical protein